MATNLELRRTADDIDLKGEMTGHPPRGLVQAPRAIGAAADHGTAERTRGTLEKAALLIGRAIFGGYFVYNGINHFRNGPMLAEYARSKGVPAPELAVAASGAMILAGGLSLLSGAEPKLGAALISTFLLGVSPSMHAFWKEDGEQQMNDMINFMKNMALVGATLLAAAQPEPWPWHVPVPGAAPAA
jgi:uncharacterized membrane protein YphA (DoxX/SURF4 family)